MCRDFKYELNTSFESCPLEECETSREKRLTKDICNVRIEYMALKDEPMSFLVCIIFLKETL